ncbi:MAG TPA: hypothetical protein EYO85_04695 [Rhodospirillales bacterium]|nr:hypothetical protein [Rhodospirillales bacterium]
MRIIGQPVVFGIAAVIVTTLVAALTLWAWESSGGVGRSTSTIGLVWNVEYWHRNAEGEVLQHKKASNAIVASGLEHAVERLITAADADATLAFTNPAAAEIGEANAFDQIVLMDTDDAASDGLLAANILLNVDGGTGDNAGQAAGGVENNPADGAYADVGTTSDGDGKVTVKFLADGNPDAATQMHLVKAAVDDTTDSGAAAIAAADVLATIEISVDLADTDTLTIEWTIDFD